jgi:hypothetical protein
MAGDSGTAIGDRGRLRAALAILLVGTIVVVNNNLFIRAAIR